MLYNILATLEVVCAVRQATQWNECEYSPPSVKNSRQFQLGFRVWISIQAGREDDDSSESPNGEEFDDSVDTSSTPIEDWTVHDINTNGTDFAVVVWRTKDGKVPKDGGEHLNSHPCMLVFCSLGTDIK